MEKLEKPAAELVMRTNMRRYAAVRTVTLAALAAAAVSTCEVLEIHIPLAPLYWIIALLALLNAAYFFRLREPWPVTEREIFANVLIDVVGLTALLYYTGGALNPLASCYLLIVLYAAMVLPRHLCWTLAALCVACYSILQVFYVPLPLPDSAGSHAILDEWTRWGMYVLLAGVVAWFGVRLNDLRRDHARQLREKDEETARERYLIGLAALAAGTAHEMGTPLSTMAMVVGEMRRNPALPPDWKESIDVLWNQLQICKHSLLGLAQASDLDQISKVRVQHARLLVHGIVERFSQMRPRVPITLHYEESVESPMLRVDVTLGQALLSLVDNAADASPGSVELRVKAADDLLTLEILDRGPGISPELRGRLGKAPVGPRNGGHGLGLMLAHSAIQRLGGSVSMQDRDGGGACVRVELPLIEEDAAHADEFLETPLVSG